MHCYEGPLVPASVVVAIDPVVRVSLSLQARLRQIQRFSKTVSSQTHTSFLSHTWYHTNLYLTAVFNSFLKMEAVYF